MRRFREVAVVMLENSKGQLFAHQRSAMKTDFPLKYGLGAGGYLKEGEGGYKGITRIIKEELKIKNCFPQYMLTFPYNKTETLVHKNHVYHMIYSEKIKTDYPGFRWSGWLSVKEINKLLKGNRLCPDTKKFYEHWLYHERTTRKKK